MSYGRLRRRRPLAALLQREGARRLRAPLGIPAFRRLAAAYSVNEFGNWLGELALAVVVFDRTGSALATGALFVSARVLPALLAPLLAARAAKEPPRTVIASLLLFQALTYVVLAGTVDHLGVLALLAIVFADGTCAIAAKALTRAATVAVLKPHGQLQAGNAVLNLAFTFGAIVGPVLAGALIAASGVGVSLAVNAVSFVAAAAIIGTARTLPAADRRPVAWRANAAAGIRYAWRRTVVRGLLLAQGVALVFFSAVVPVEIVLAKETFDGGNVGYGLLLAAWAAGMATGSVLFATRTAVNTRLLLASTAAIGTAYLGMALAPTLLVACAWAVVGGAGNGLQWVSVLTALQSATDDEHQVSVMTLFEGVSTVAPGLGFLLGGALASLASARLSFTVAGAGVLVLVAVALTASRSGRALDPALGEAAG